MPFARRVYRLSAAARGRAFFDSRGSRHRIAQSENPPPQDPSSLPNIGIMDNKVTADTDIGGDFGGAQLAPGKPCYGCYTVVVIYLFLEKISIAEIKPTSVLLGFIPSQFPVDFD